ncbi:PepSY domain-containing protein [Teichococcus deserti]|uniref:PepSY domain-containing protein n=1 Tax=Teichococcus deserti TaxID=1817963 RepID=UPI001F60233B|nr:PepSY domain-containing protein [Pseudoroseomonas deserti]
MTLPRFLLLTGLLLLPLAPAQADRDDWRRLGCRNEQDCARQALERGEIRPLEDVLAVARRAVPGDIVGVELDRDDGRWVYEIKVLTAGGKRREIEIEATTLRILEID